VATSKQSETLGRQQGLPLMTSWDEPIDITFDGADLVDTEGTAVKGLGGALLREKIVATNSCKLILLIDERKMQNSPSSFILPIAVIPFGIHATMKTIEKMGFHSTLRMQEKNPFVSDDGYWILDISMGGALRSLKEIDVALKAIPGVVETGLFYRLASEVIIGYSDGRVERHPFF
jgi:ribose 5-phosphate isomerase A